MVLFSQKVETQSVRSKRRDPCHIQFAATRRLVVLAAVGGLALALSACGSSTSGDGSGNVAAVVKGLDNPFFQTMESGIKDEASTAGTEVTVQAANSITDTTGQADKLNGLAGQDFKCFIVNPITGTNLIQGIAQLSAKNVPIVNIDSPIDADAAKAANAKITTYIGTDNADAGAKAAAEMGKLLPGGGTVALIGGTSGDVTSAARLDGFTKAVPANLKIVSTVAADWERQMALTKATDIMTANPTLSAFFVANDDMGLGVAQAIANRGKTGSDQGHQRRRQQGRVRGRQDRRHRRRGGAVPVRDRRNGRRRVQGRRRRKDAARRRQGTGAGRHQGQRR